MSSDIQQPAWVADLRPPRWLGLLLVSLPLLVFAAFVYFQANQLLPRIGLAPGYSLIDQDGNRFTNETVRGSLVLYNFTHSRCTDDCFDSSIALLQLQHRLDDLDTGGIPLKFVTISTDASHDTPEVLRTYAAKLGADTDRWHFLSGSTQQLDNFVRAGVQPEIASAGYHDDKGQRVTRPFLALVDGWGIIRATYNATTPDVELLRRDLRAVAQEARNSIGVNRYAYEAVHLFMCHNGIYQ